MSEHASQALRQKMNEQRAAAAASAPKQQTKEEFEKQKKLNELLAANVVFGSSSLGGPVKTATDKVAVKPYVSHIVVKDLRRVAHNMNVVLPDSNLFIDRSAVALFALFDGQSSADVESPGSQAVEWCCRNIHAKLLKNMSSLTPRETNEAGVMAMLQRSLAELDQELLVEQLTIQDGCGASVALLIGDTLFMAVIGKCGVLLCTPSSQPANGCKTARPPLGSTSRASATAPVFTVRSIDDTQAQRPQWANPRSLGDRAWKNLGGIPLPFVQATCSSCKLSHENGHSVLLLTSQPVSQNLSFQNASDVVIEFDQRPRAISGEVVAKVREAFDLQQSTHEASEAATPHHSAVTVVFLPPKEIPYELHSMAPKSAKLAPAPPPSKKQRVEAGKPETLSLRLRHILVRHSDCNAAFDPLRQKPVSRHPSEADRILRQALRDLLKDQATIKLPGDPKKAALVHMQPSTKCIALTKELSECMTAQKAGIVCGDLEWMTAETMRTTFGAAFAESAKALVVGQWSDLVASDLGLHLMQRIA